MEQPTWSVYAGTAVAVVDEYYRTSSPQAFSRLVDSTRLVNVPASPLIRQHPQLWSNWRIRQHLARALYFDGKLIEALYHCDTALKASPTSTPGILLMAEIFERMRLPDSALTRLELLRRLLRRDENRQRARALRISSLEVAIRMCLFLRRDDDAAVWLRHRLRMSEALQLHTIRDALRGLDAEKHGRELAMLLDRVSVSQLPTEIRQLAIAVPGRVRASFLAVLVQR